MMTVFTERDRRALKLSTSHPGKFLKKGIFTQKY